MKVVDWFVSRQFRIAGTLAAVCSGVALLIDPRGVFVLAVSILCVADIFVAGRLFQGETTESWLDNSWSGLIRNVVGGILMLFGWVTLLRVVVATTIAAILLKTD